MGLGLSLRMGLGAGGNGWGAKLAPPEGFSFPFGTYPITVYSAGRTNFIPEDWAPDALDGIPYYVDPSTGSDSNNGLSAGARKKSVHAAIAAGNAGGVPFYVRIRNQAGGLVPRENGINFGTNPTQKCALIAENGPVSFGTHSLLTYTPDATYTGAYETSRTNVARVFWLGATDAYGNPVELTRVTAVEDMAGDPGAIGIWYNSGATFKIKLAGGAVVNNDSVLALLSTQNIQINSLSSDFYAKGLILYGGNVGAFYANGVIGNVVAENVEARLAGTAGAVMDGFRLIDVQGLSGFLRCGAYSNSKDGFNSHRTAAPENSIFVLTDRCVGMDNGRFESQSNNFITPHEDVAWLDAGGIARDNYGGQVHAVNDSQMWCVGTDARNSRGDVSLGGGIGPTEFITQQNAQIWLENTAASARTSGDYAIRARDTSTILKRRHRTIQGIESAEVGSVIGTF